MDLTSIFLFCLISLVIGAVLMILVQYYIFIKYFNQPDNDPNASQRNRSLNERYQLPDAILGSIHSPELENRNPTIAFNLIFQFLFFELRNANRVRKWFHRKLSLELDELITKTTTGKLFEKLSIRDLDLGAQFPEIRNIKILNAELHDTEGHLENVELLLDLDYHGNFHLSIDADMVLGKKGFLSIKVNHVSGLARLNFTRKPYTHWSLVFMGDPAIELDIETQFQGSRLVSQSNVTNLISNQIRKAIRRKHTLPNYKLRYKPFFHNTADDDIDLSEVQFDGTLDVNVAELTRLSLPCHVNQVFCTLTMAPMAWVTATQYDDRNILCTFDIEIHKAKNQQIGIIFKQIEQTVLIDAIIPNTPAMKAELCKGDMLVSIEGKKISNINQIAKIVKSLNRPVFFLRIERIVAGHIKSDMNSFAVGGDTDEESYEVINDVNINISFSKTADTVQISKNVRQSSIDKLSTESGSRSNTPTNSPIKSKDDITSKLRYRGTNRNNPSDTKQSDDLVKCTTPVKVNTKMKSDPDTDTDTERNENEYEMHSTIECAVNTFISINDLCQFKLNQKSQFLNLNVLGRCNDETILLGYNNIPIQNVLYECSDSTLAHFIKQFKLNPPDTPDLSTHLLSSQAGFDPNLCFGDVLMSFSWTGGSTAAGSDSIKKTKHMKLSSSAEKLTEEKGDVNVSRQHNFQRKHFQSSTQCDFCGRKIWLKDGVQCRDCSMNCHKKCITKCQASTICGPVDAAAALQQSTLNTSAVEFKVTDADGEGEIDDFEEIDEPKPKLDHQHRQSFSEMISQGIKRVNSANNLAIPAIVSSLNQGTRSLPPSPQHTPRKQSLVNQSSNPFVVVIQKLDQLPNKINDITREQIVSLTEPLIGWDGPDEMMALAKITSKTLFVDLDAKERVEVINNLLSKLKLALDSETTAHANLVASDAFALLGDNKTQEKCNAASNNGSTLTTDYKTRRSSSAESTPRKTKDNEHELAGKAFLVGQSEERVQALSVIMLHLCTGLQYAQGVANH